MIGAKLIEPIFEYDLKIIKKFNWRYKNMMRLLGPPRCFKRRFE